jgi:hypothetical protein
MDASDVSVAAAQIKCHGLVIGNALDSRKRNGSLRRETHPVRRLLYSLCPAQLNLAERITVEEVRKSLRNLNERLELSTFRPSGSWVCEKTEE